MNAKKIMGAVLVALLAAALFVGAGAAAEETAAGTFYVYENSAAVGALTGSYSCGDATVSVVGSTPTLVPSDLSKFVNGGKYSNGTHYIVVKLPNVEFTAVGGDIPNTYDVMANGLIAGQNVTFTGAAAGAGATIANITIYNPDGTPTTYSVTGGNKLDLKGSDAIKAKGTYQIQGVLDFTGADFETSIMPANLVYGQKYTFNVYSAEPTIAASADTVIVNNFITVTVTGIPGHTINLSAPGFDVAAKHQIAPVTIIKNYSTGDGKSEVQVNIPNTGSIVVYLEAKETGKKILSAKDINVATPKIIKAEVKIVKGTITAQADADYFFIGNPIALSGTTDSGSELYFYIEGTNFPFTQIDLSEVASEELDVVGEQWTIELDSSAIESYNGKKLVAGTYTVVVSKFDNATERVAQSDLKEAVMDTTYGTAAVSLTQPFLTGIEANAVAIQDTDYFVSGTAYSAKDVYLYVFGTNFFAAQVTTTNDDETFEFEIDRDVTKEMAPGTYFYLIQHPMNDGKFNVWEGASAGSAPLAGTNGNTENVFYYAPTNGTAINATIIFDVYKRGTNYAAQALLEAISGQDIDDIFVQGTFEVEAQKLTINPIPAEVAQGSALAVSGTTNSGEGVEVIINVLAGTFGATIKGDENAATFLTQKAVTNEDGTWEAAIDTSKLEVGNYIVTVELNGQMYDSAAVEIVAAGDEPVDPEQPGDEPEQPGDEPVAPETPGFGALAALAGLGAVAVLLLRRE